MAAPLILLTLNIEKEKHLEKRVLPFVREHMPDVICFQELLDVDAPKIATELGLNHVYMPMSNFVINGETAAMGIGIFSKLPLSNPRVVQYSGHQGPLLFHDERTDETRHATTAYGLVVAEVEKDGVRYKIGTTHFVWAGGGGSNKWQEEDVQDMLKVLKPEGEIVFTGDFNAPRGGIIFDLIATHYKDNIPSEYTTSIDGNLHKRGPLPYMVDGIFSTPGYKVSHVEIQTGLSDHCGFTAEISKA